MSEKGSRRGSAHSEEDGQGSADNNTSKFVNNVENDIDNSVHRPKIRVPGDAAPKKIKLLTSNINSTKIIRSDQATGSKTKGQPQTGTGINVQKQASDNNAHSAQKSNGKLVLK